MFSFSEVREIVTAYGDVGDMGPEANEAAAARRPAKKERQFVEITVDTPLKALSRFFEWNSAAVVTERDGSDGPGAAAASSGGGMKPVAVVTKVDLLTWLMKQSKVTAP